MKKIYIDGQAGTTGLQIHERLKNRPDLQLLEIDPALRKDPQARRALMEEADLVFLCLPDAAAKEAVELMLGMDTKIIHQKNTDRFCQLRQHNSPCRIQYPHFRNDFIRKNRG